MRHRARAVRITLPIAVVVAVSLIISVATGAIPRRRRQDQRLVRQRRRSGAGDRRREVARPEVHDARDRDQLESQFQEERFAWGGRARGADGSRRLPERPELLPPDEAQLRPVLFRVQVASRHIPGQVLEAGGLAQRLMEPSTLRVAQPGERRAAIRGGRPAPCPWACRPSSSACASTSAVAKPRVSDRHGPYFRVPMGDFREEL
jgi:hypothetical protein